MTLRDVELWTMLTDLSHCTVWSLMGMSVKPHHQQMSKQAAIISDMLGRTATRHSGAGKGKGKGKAKPTQ